MPLIRTATRLARLPTLLRAPLCRRCTSGAPSEYLQGPSEKQLAYAEALAEQVGVDVPEDVRADKIACSEFIDQQLRRLPPSDKQLAYAEALAEKFGADVPEDVRTSKIACSEFIDQQKQREPPSEKQLAFVKELAQQAQIDPPDRACVSSAGASHHALLHTHTLHHAAPTPRPSLELLSSQRCARTACVLFTCCWPPTTGASAFIDAMLPGGGGIAAYNAKVRRMDPDRPKDPPSREQLLSAAGLVRRKYVD